jgi:superfamily II DNA helicase RecQ
MSAYPVPQCAINIYKIFKEILKTNCRSPDGLKTLYTEAQITWATKIWISNYDNLRKNSNTFYMTLVLMNRKTLSGNFSLIYNDNIYRAIEKKKEKELVKLFNTPYFTELYDNNLLNKEEVKGLEIVLKKEMLAMNFFIKSIENNSKIQEDFLNSDIYQECFYQIHPLVNIYVSREDSKFLSTTNVDYVNITEYNENTDSYQVMSFDLQNLLSLINFDENNTYTNKPFDEKTIKSIKDKYVVELKLINRSYGKK